MESKLERKYGAWEYTSKSGLKYTVGEVTAEFNVIIDDFMDVVEMFDTNVLVESQMVGYVYGDLEHGDKEDIKYIKEYLDYVTYKYEHFERTVRFYRDIIGKNTDVLYECYIGKEKENKICPIKISYDKMKEIAFEDKNL